MTDYLPLISRAVEGLDKGTGEARRALYERARAALVSQLRAVEPALSESEITRERLALEDAIRKVEAEAARKSRAEPRVPRPAAPAVPPLRERLGPAADSGRATVRPSEPLAPSTARERLLNARAPEPAPARQGGKGFRNVMNEVRDLGAATVRAARSARETRESYGRASPRPHAAEEDTESPLQEFEPQLNAEELRTEADEATRWHDREFDETEADILRHPVRRPPHPEEEEQHLPPSYRGLIRIAVALIILVGIGVTISWQWPNISGMYRYVAQIGSKQRGPTSQTAAQPKFSGRVPQEQNAGQAAGTAAPGSQAAPAVAQRVVLYEEDSNDPQGKRYVGSVIWRTETVSPGAGLAPELAVRADVEIPERHITMTWSLRRNTDKALPASHTIEIQFTLPADFPGGGIANVPGLLMKQSEQARGTPLAGLAVKVTNGFFLIGLSATDTDVQRNIELLKERPWFDIPIVYTNGGRAILAMEKGPPGDRAFAEAFAAWEKK
ncbi:MAG TPA: hypothetical protein VEJ37_10025 [Xanthobacteraceae bacterium]|nr:hypothetical protein [Xanthobacteraceae bacterium]